MYSEYYLVIIHKQCCIIEAAQLWNEY